MDDIDQAVAGLAAYQHGKPARPLNAIREIVRDTAAAPKLRRHLEAGLIKLLDSDASHESKLFACQQLWVLGSDAATPVLGRMLLDPKTAHMACYAIGQNPSPKAGAALRSALGKAKGEPLVQIVIQLGQRRDQASVAALSKLLASGDATVAETAAAALGRIGGEQAAKALADAREDPDLRLAASRASLQCAERLAEQDRTEQALAIYEELHDAKQPRLIRRGALVGLMRVGGQRMVPLVISVLRGEDAMMKATAVAGIRTMRGEGIVERFATELSRLEPGVQVLLVGALAGRGGAAVREAIESAAGSAEAEVRTAAVKALGQVGDASSVPVLAKAAAGAREEGASAPLLSLRRLRGQGVDAAIVAAMKGAKPRVRATLIEVLQDREASAAAVPALLEQTAHGDAAVRGAAFRALGRLAGPQQVPALTRRLAAVRMPAVRKETERAVVLACRRIEDESSRADAVLEALDGAEDATIRCSLLRVLGGIANARAFDALKAAMDDASPEVRDTAVRELSAWPDRRALAPLMEIVKGAGEHVHRVIALRGYVRLLGEAGGIPTPQTLAALQSALQQARGPQEQKLILGALARVGHPRALALIEPLLGEQGVRAEAELALLRVAQTAAGAAPEATQSALSKLLETSKDAGRRQQAQRLLDALGKLGDYVVAWQVSGPYTQEGKQGLDLFHVAFPPEQAKADAGWRLLQLGPADRPWMLDLAGALGEGEHRAAYVRSWLYADQRQPARLEFGTDDGNKVWLNGKLVHAKNVGGAAKPGGYQANVLLRPGWNALMLKVTQLTGPWEFCLAVRSREGKALGGVRADCLRQPDGN
ncbi:MAG: HEAT repeat domain-containing protein [Planctomycetota bacterium]